MRFKWESQVWEKSGATINDSWTTFAVPPRKKKSEKKLKRWEEAVAAFAGVPLMVVIVPVTVADAEEIEEEEEVIKEGRIPTAVVIMIEDENSTLIHL